ncbi:hypothetical protein ACRE98_29585, partial [Klebsiella pneumoniae]
QHVKGQTHKRGHTLDLVFTLGVSISSVELVDMTISDHRCIVFSCDSPVTHAASPSSVCSRIFNEQSVSKFCAFFQSQSQHLSDSNTNNLVDHFNHICLSSLNITAPLKVRPTSKASKQPWINDSIRSLKRECRKAERRWKKSSLQVHYLSLKDLLINYNNMVKDARTHYFSELITTHKHNPRFLFKTVDQLINPTPPCASAGSNDD